jgi:hypothetical protein
MGTVAGRIAEQGLKLLNEIAAEAFSLESFASSGLECLPQLVASEVTTLSICDLVRGRRTVFSTPARAFSAAERASFDAHFHEHPLVLYHSTTPGGTTHRISDSLPHSKFRETPLYNDYYRAIGIDHVMALPLYVDRRFLVSFVFNRKRRDFDTAERDALDVLRPQLAALFGQAVSQERTRSLLAQLDSLAATGGWSAIELDGRGAFCAPPTRLGSASRPVGRTGTASSGCASPKPSIAGFESAWNGQRISPAPWRAAPSQSGEAAGRCGCVLCPIRQWAGAIFCS